MNPCSFDLCKARALSGLTKEGAENDGLKSGQGGERQPHAVTSDTPYNLRVSALKVLLPLQSFSLLVLQN